MTKRSGDLIAIHKLTATTEELKTSLSDSIPSATSAKECPISPVKHLMVASERSTNTPMTTSGSLSNLQFRAVSTIVKVSLQSQFGASIR
jgi:hypothetical protein